MLFSSRIIEISIILAPSYPALLFWLSGVSGYFVKNSSSTSSPKDFSFFKIDAFSLSNSPFSLYLYAKMKFTLFFRSSQTTNKLNRISFSLYFIILFVISFFASSIHFYCNSSFDYSSFDSLKSPIRMGPVCSPSSSYSRPLWGT